MNEIIAKGLKEQLRVLSIFLDEYKKELDGNILSMDYYQDLKEITKNVIAFIEIMHHI